MPSSLPLRDWAALVVMEGLLMHKAGLLGLTWALVSS